MTALSTASIADIDQVIQELQILRDDQATKEAGKLTPLTRKEQLACTFPDKGKVGMMKGGSLGKGGYSKKTRTFRACRAGQYCCCALGVVGETDGNRINASLFDPALGPESAATLAPSVYNPAPSMLYLLNFVRTSGRLRMGSWLPLHAPGVSCARPTFSRCSGQLVLKTSFMRTTTNNSLGCGVR